MSRLTKKGTRMVNDFREADWYNKLANLEDILEEYGVEDLTELKIALDYYEHRYDGGVYTERVVVDDK
jgi:hypothetical protein